MNDSEPWRADPRAFWDQFVQPAIMEWFGQEGDVRRATIALCELDNFAEHMLLFHNPALRFSGTRAERDKLCDQLPELGIARDIHDVHKHGWLRRKTATITKAPDIQEDEWLFPPFGDLPSTDLWIEDAAGKRYRLGDVIWKCRDHWDAEMKRAGLVASHADCT